MLMRCLHQITGCCLYRERRAGHNHTQHHSHLLCTNLIVTLGRSIIGAVYFEFSQKLGYNIIMLCFMGIITVIPGLVTWLLQFSGTLNQAARQVRVVFWQSRTHRNHAGEIPIRAPGLTSMTVTYPYSPATLLAFTPQPCAWRDNRGLYRCLW